MTSRALADALRHRFGGGIADAVLAELGIGPGDRAVDLVVVEQATAMALDAELVVVGSQFVMLMPISALANSPRFQRAALQAGVPAERLDAAQRLRIDAAFARRWHAGAGVNAPNLDLERAQATMAAVLLDELA